MDNLKTVNKVVTSRATKIIMAVMALAISCTVFLSKYEVNSEHTQQAKLTLTASDKTINKNEIFKTAHIYSQEYAQFGQSLIDAVISIESDGDANKVSPKGEIGLMQIRPLKAIEILKKKDMDLFILAKHLNIDTNKKTDYEIVEECLFDPRINVMIGGAYLLDLRDEFNDTRLSLMAYNWGASNIRRKLEDSNYHVENTIISSPIEVLEYANSVIRLSQV